MTATIDMTPPAADLGAATVSAVPVRAPGADLLDLLTARLADLEFAEPDEFHTRGESGRELLELAATARRAAAYLGGQAGATLTTGSTAVAGVVVVRELVAATRRLASAVALTSAP